MRRDVFQTVNNLHENAVPRRVVFLHYFSWATGSYLRSIKTNSRVNDKHVETFAFASLILLYYVDAFYDSRTSRKNWSEAKSRQKLYSWFCLTDKSLFSTLRDYTWLVKKKKEKEIEFCDVSNNYPDGKC